MRMPVDNPVESVQNSRFTGQNGLLGRGAGGESCMNIFETHPKITDREEYYGNQTVMRGASDSAGNYGNKIWHCAESEVFPGGFAGFA